MIQNHTMQYQALALPPPESWTTMTTTTGSYYYTYIPTPPHHYHPTPSPDPLATVAKLAAQNAVVIFSLSTCCMCYAVKSLFSSLGVNPTVYELDEDPVWGRETQRALARLMGSGGGAAVPVVFVGGELVGSMDRVMGAHINGTLVPMLKKAGALWL